MMNTKNVTLATLVCGFVMLFVVAQNTSAQTLPPGSYQKTCFGIKVEGAQLTAGCMGKTSTIDQLTGAGTAFGAPSTLSNFFECDGDISNDNGNLKCTRNWNSTKLKQARASIDFGMKTVLNKKATGPVDYNNLLGQMFRDGMLANFYAGLSANDASNFFDKYLTAPEHSNLRASVIDQAFNDVYSFGASPQDQAFWNAELPGKHGGYSYIVNVERLKLNSEKIVRRLMISNAYKKAMGRMPTTGDFNYWQPRPETFREIVDASRAFLYSSNGAKDLAETVARSLESKTGSAPTTQQVTDALLKYTKTKAIFDEM